MSLYNYFNKLGTSYYNGEITTNIIKSIRFKDIVLKNKINFYSYTIREGERPDSIANHYYDDSRYAWLVLLCNSIIDPYYEWPLSSENFNRHIVKKYGSIKTATEKTIFYKNNWRKDDSMISTNVYQSLPSNRKKYWDVVLGYNNEILNYERRKSDNTLETNMIVELSLSNVTGLFLEQQVIQKTSGVITASGNIKAIKDTSIIVNNVLGEFATTSGNVGSITTEQNNVSKNILSTTVINVSIPLDEAVYWEPISAYDYEFEINESRKEINLIDKSYLPLIEDQMVELLA